VASSLAMQLQVSVESLTRFQGPERFAGPLLFERLDLKNLCFSFLSERPFIVFLDSGVRKHPGNLVLIRLGDKRRPAELALGLGGLGGEDVAHLGLAALELAGAGLMKALGCAAVCLQLWHGVPDENCVLDNLLSIYEDGRRGCIYFRASFRLNLSICQDIGKKGLEAKEEVYESGFSIARK
jgi:hypothetical protein